MRAVLDVLDVLDDLGIEWFVTGLEAAARYGVLRQTFDTDVVIDLQRRGLHVYSGSPRATAMAAIIAS
jgi:hypothetical protein